VLVRRRTAAVVAGGGRSFRLRLLEHPALLPLVATRPARGQVALRSVESVLEILTGKGFTAPDALAVSTP
jgi:hypothetical protein